MNLTQTKTEKWWVIEQDSHYPAWIEANGLAHDRHLIPLLEGIIQPGWVCIDVGALYGDHSISYCKSVSKDGNKDGCVIAIEANPLAFQALSKNAERFEGSIVLINAVVGQEHGTKAIHTMEEGTEVNVGASRVVTFGAEKTKLIEKEVPCVSIDGLVMDAHLTNGVNFIKYDVEGWEYKALLGSKGTLQHPKNKPVLLIEINKATLALQGAKDTDIYDFLLSVDYQWRIVQPDCHGNSPQFDVLAWPNPIQAPKIVAG